MTGGVSPTDQEPEGPFASEYDPLGSESGGDDLLRVQDAFATASEPYLSFPLSWLTWGLLLPAGALGTESIVEALGMGAGFVLWFAVVLLGGLVEGVGILRGRRRYGTTALGGWVTGAQANLSLVAVLLSVALLVAGQSRLVPGLWLLLLGHSFFSLGGLAFPPFRRYALWYQLNGALALWPVLIDPLLVFAVATSVGNLGVAWVLWRSP